MPFPYRQVFRGILANPTPKVRGIEAACRFAGKFAPRFTTSGFHCRKFNWESIAIIGDTLVFFPRMVAYNEHNIFIKATPWFEKLLTGNMPCSAQTGRVPYQEANRFIIIVGKDFPIFPTVAFVVMVESYFYLFHMFILFHE